MSSKNTVILHYETAASLEDSFETLLDLKKFGQHHPFKMEVKELKRNSAVSVEYRIIEEAIVLGFIKMHPAYNAEVIEIEKYKQIRYVSQVKKNISLKIDFTFFADEKNKKTIVREEIEVEANKFVGSYFIGMLKKTHLLLFKKMGAVEKF